MKPRLLNYEKKMQRVFDVQNRWENWWELGSFYLNFVAAKQFRIRLETLMKSLGIFVGFFSSLKEREEVVYLVDGMLI